MESAAFRPIEGQKVALTLTEPSNGQAWLNFRNSEQFEIFAVVCGECGYTEMHTERPQEMWRRWESGYR
jgi:hypothetical protein